MAVSSTTKLSGRHGLLRLFGVLGWAQCNFTRSVDRVLHGDSRVVTRRWESLARGGSSNVYNLFLRSCDALRNMTATCKDSGDLGYMPLTRTIVVYRALPGVEGNPASPYDNCLLKAHQSSPRFVASGMESAPTLV